MGRLSLLRGIFPTRGSNPGLPHCRWILYQLSHQGSPHALNYTLGFKSVVDVFVCVSSVAQSYPTLWCIYATVKSIHRVSKQSRKTHSPSLRQWFPLKTIQTPWDSLTSMEVLSLEPALLWAVPVSVQNSPYNSYQKPDSLCLLVFVLLDLYFASYFR